MQRIILCGPQSCRSIFVLEALQPRWMSLHRRTYVNISNVPSIV